VRPDKMEHCDGHGRVTAPWYWNHGLSVVHGNWLPRVEGVSDIPTAERSNPAWKIVPRRIPGTSASFTGLWIHLLLVLLREKLTVKYKILVRKPEGKKRSLGRQRRRWEDIRMVKVKVKVSLCFF
jgi:hypothetical protein